VSCWNLATGAPHQPALQIDRATALAFAPDGRELAVGTRDDGIHFVDLTSGRSSARFSVGEDQVGLLAFSPDGKRLVSSQVHPSLQRSFVKLWSRADGSSKDLGVADGGNTQFSPDGRWILIGGAILWDSASGELLGRLRLDELNYGMATAFHPNGGILSGGPGGGVILATPNRPACERLQGHQASLRVLRFSPDGRTLASAGLERGIRIWDVAAGREGKPYTGHSSGGAALAWSPDGRSVVSASSNRELHCWDPVTRELRWSSSMSTIMARDAWWLEFSPDGNQILSSSENGVLGLWDSFTGASLGRITATNTLAGMDGAAWSPDGAHIAALFKDRVAIWKAQSGQEQWSVPAHADRCVRFSRDGRWLVHGNYDGSVSLRNSGDGRLLRSFDRHQASVKGVAFSPDGRRLFSGGADGTVRVWDTRTGDELLQLHVTGDRVVWSIDLSPDGRTLAAADSDGVVTLWKTE
jgi:WD40 repeat protein